MTTVANITPRLRELRVPKDIAQLTSWLMWRYEQHPDEAKARKIPYYTDGGKRSGRQGTPQDRARLTTFQAARETAARRGFDGIGFAPLPGLGIVALDFDNCFRPDGSLPDEIEDIIARTYCEYSPSGKGLRAFVRGDVGNRKSGTSAGDFGFETFSTNGFVTVTGQLYWTTEMFGTADEIATIDDRVLSLCQKRFGQAGPDLDVDDVERAFNLAEPRIGLTIEQMEEVLACVDPDCGRADWIKVGMALHHECEGDDTGFYLWNEWSAKGGKYPSEAALQEQWDSFTRRDGRGHRPVTFASAIQLARQGGYEGRSGPSPATGAELLAEAEKRSSNAEAGSEQRFEAIPADQFARRPYPEWIIKGVLPRADLAVLYGASGAGKSFVALDIAAAIALGRDWRGRKTKPGRVVYIAAEGGGGMAARIAAYCLHHGVSLDALGKNLAIIAGVPDLLKKEDCTDLVASIRKFGKTDVVFIDTFAQVTPGANENAGEDMGRALSHARAIKDATGAVNVLVHHSGKDAAKGARGWSGIRAAADAELEVTRDEETGERGIHTRKQKDGDDSLSWGFKLTTVLVGLDQDDEEVSSCVIVDTGPIEPRRPAEKSKRKTRGRWENLLLDAITTLPMETADMTIGAFLDHAMTMTVAPDEGKRDTRRQHLQRAFVALSKDKGDDIPFFTDHGKIILL